MSARLAFLVGRLRSQTKAMNSTAARRFSPKSEKGAKTDILL